MPIVIEFKNNETVNIKHFFGATNIEKYMQCVEKLRNVQPAYEQKHMRVYELDNGSSVVLLDTPLLSLDTPIPGGVLHTDTKCDENYPGLDIEYIPDNPNEYSEEVISPPRIVIEKPVEENKLNVMLWNDLYDEDYTTKRTFD